MKRLVWIGHYIEEPDRFLFNDIKLRSSILKKIFINVNKHMPPYICARFNSEKRGIEFYGMICPLMPSELASSGKSRQADIIKDAIQLANKLKATQIGLAALFASIWESGDEVKKLTDVPVTTGKNLIAALTIDYVSRGVDLLGKNIKSLNVGIVGYKNRISKIFLKQYSPIAKEILVDSADEFMGSVKNARKASYEDIFRQSDVIIVTNMGVGLAEYIGIMKPGAMVCDIVVPYYLAKEIRKKRADIFAFEGVWSMYKYFDEFTGNNFKRLFPNNIAPACIAELIILAQENKQSCFSLGDNISYENTAMMKSFITRNGFDFFGFKQGLKIYSNDDIENIRSGMGQRDEVHAV
ncbi:MAG: hypothetical protein WCY36_04020 [Candidatus Omnitrophota bacterium]